MIAGHTQVIDGALLKANASKDSLEIKQVSKGVDEYLSENIKANTNTTPACQTYRADDGNNTWMAMMNQTRQLKELDTRYQRQEKIMKRCQAVKEQIPEQQNTLQSQRSG